MDITSTGNKKGFALSLLMGLLLALIFVSIAIWSASLQQRDERDSQAFKFYALQSILSSSSDDGMRPLGEILAREAIRNLDWHIRYSGIYSGNVSKDLREMMVYGRCRMVDLNNDGVPDLAPALVQQCVGAAPAGIDCDQFDMNGDGAVDALDVACLSQVSPAPTRNSLAFFNSSMNEFAKERGFGFSVGIAEFNASMSGPWNVSLNFTLNISISDSSGEMGSSRISRVELSIPIEGFEDPLVGAESWKTVAPPLNRPPGAERQIFRFPEGREYRAVEVTAPTTPDSRRGKGWVYANLTTDTSPAGRNKENILVLVSAEGNYDILGDYAGVIVTEPPVVRRTERKTITQSSATCTVTCEYYMREDYQNCLDCLRYAPYECDLVSQTGTECPTVRPQEPTTLTGAHSINVPYALGVGNYGQLAMLPAALINSPTNNSVTSFNRQVGAADAEVYNIEGLRALAVCGYYIRSDSGPDFLQRMAGELSATNNPNGIESLLVGRWANETYNDLPLSHVDYSYYSNVTGAKIKGMPGCKSQAMCTRDGPLGNFALDYLARIRYNANRIYCITEDC
ncbi:MAG: hypothetical protein NT157_01965 [Candidatus Micrarchaeota archaeon]|nr:hypothetical protein [Candidatus Micrarchaeota archaeon]